jgi:hypothetical protein
VRPSDDDLKRWRDLAAKASPGPWRYDEREDAIVQVNGGLWGNVLTGEPTYEGNHGLSGAPEDIEFVAAAREAVPALLDEIERMRSLLAAFGVSYQ